MYPSKEEEELHGPAQPDWWNPPQLTNTLVISPGSLFHVVCLQGHDTLAPRDRAGRAGKALEFVQAIALPTLTKLCPQALSLGLLDQIACFQVPERHFSVCSPTQAALRLSFP